MNDRSRYDATAILRGAMVGGSQWRLLTLFTITVLWTTVMASFPAWRVLASVLDTSPRAKQIAQSFDLLAIEDMGMALYRSGAPVTGAASLATLLGILSWPFLAGMAIAAARGPRPRTFVEMIEGGVAYYARMLRVGLVAIVPLALIGGVATLGYKGARYHAQHSILESQASTGSRIAIAITVIVFVVVHATIEAGRAAYGVDDRLRSGWIAWLRGVRLTARDPGRVLGAYLAATLASYAVAFPLLILRLRISGPSGVGLFFGFVLTQMAVASLGWGRAARLFAMTAISRAHAPVSVTSADTGEATPDDAQGAPAGSMFRELGARKPVARRG
jgi:hypothetical protein